MLINNYNDNKMFAQQQYFAINKIYLHAYKHKYIQYLYIYALYNSYIRGTT